MRYKLLGKSGLRVSELALGTMTFGEDWGWGASKEESKKQFDCFAEAGGNYIDTSVNYTAGTAEKYVGEFIHSDRDHFVVATKYTLTRPDDTDPNGGGNSRKNMMKSVERSLQHLQTDHIDLYYLHMWDYLTPVEEVVRGLDDLVRAGKVLYVAFSDTPAYIVAEANTMASLRGWSPFIGLQLPYSLLDRAIERDLLPMAKHWEMAVMPFGLVEAGILTGKFLNKPDTATRINPDEVKLSDKAKAVVLEVQKIAQETGHSMAQVAINWVRQRLNNLMIPILGARTVEHLKDNMGCLEWKLSDEQIKRLDDLSKIDMGFPHGFLDRNPYIFGATEDLIDKRR